MMRLAISGFVCRTHLLTRGMKIARELMMGMRMMMRTVVKVKKMKNIQVPPPTMMIKTMRETTVTWKPATTRRIWIEIGRAHV